MAEHDFLAGKELFQQRARAAFPLLVRQATQGRNATICYSELASELLMPNVRNLNNVLGYIGTAIQKLSKEWKEKIPPIQCIVVNKRSGIPGKGIGWFITDTKNFHKLPKTEQNRLLELELQKVRQYPKWHKVLDAFGLKSANIDNQELVKSVQSIGSNGESRGARFGTGGESAEHKLLKQYVARHPEIVGLPKSIAKGVTEKNISSGDVLDVFFVHKQLRIAIEVKSSISQDSDIVRGMYQCIKYQSVLEAEQAVEGAQRNARTVLVLESKLPETLVPIRSILGIELIENIKPK